MHIFTLSPTSSKILLEISCSLSTLRAVRMSFRSWGDVRANSKAVLRPIPEDAPVMRIVFPLRFFAIEVS
jgi:hypothetical protein